jgi:predicted TIM-barrel fold metal-dependent hydrolase
MKDILALARKKNLILLAHSDHETIDALLSVAPNLTVIWAHGGFDVDVNIIANKLKHNQNLYVELSFREGITEQGVLTSTWRKLFMTYPSRFLVGTDTYTGQRWLVLPELTDHYQGWLKQLPRNIAEAIAYKNGERIAAQKPVRNE